MRTRNGPALEHGLELFAAACGDMRDAATKIALACRAMHAATTEMDLACQRLSESLGRVNFRRAA